MMKNKIFYEISLMSFVLLLFFVSRNVERCSGNIIHSSSFRRKESIIIEEATATGTATAEEMKKKPLQVFLLIGQSTMQGHGFSDYTDVETGIPLNGTLDWLINQEEYSNVHLKDTSTKDWVQRDDVWIAYNKQKSKNDTLPQINAHGKLTVGPYGGNPGQMMQVGPELGFGFTIGDAIGAANDRQVLLLKIAWNKKNLAVDFRPPSSSVNVNEGIYYRSTMNNINTTLGDLKSLFPSYCDDKDDDSNYDVDCSCNGYEIAGLVWHGDGDDGDVDTMMKQYESNLVNLIRDIRNELHLPKLPVTIGISGMCGYQNSGLCDSLNYHNYEEIVQAQLSVSNNPDKYPDFKDTVISVDTRMFARKGKPLSPGNVFYFWNNNCESFWLIGKAMGDAMLQLLDKNDPTSISGTTIDGDTINNESIDHGKENQHTTNGINSILDESATATKEYTKEKEKKPLQVFLLIGQNNMQGHGYSDLKDNNTNTPLNGTLDWLLNQKEYSDVHLKDNNTNEWIQRDDVWIAYNKQKSKNDTLPQINAHGNLADGPYGGYPRQLMQIGPELGFGFTIGDAIGAANDRQVLLLKIAWSDKNLAVDFRPPCLSSSANGGTYYRATMDNINKTLGDLKSLFPSYCDDGDDRSNYDVDCSCNGYEIAGLAWHGGWMDGLHENMVLEYERNLVSLIRDIRNELKLPKLPVTIGVLGVCGYQDSGLCDDLSHKKDIEDLVQAQLAVSNNLDTYPDFKDTVMSVDTRMFARKGSPFSPGNQIYHWNNNCESYWLIGKAMGEAMLQLLDKNNPISISGPTIDDVTINETLLIGTKAASSHLADSVVCGVDRDECTYDVNFCCANYACVGPKNSKMCALPSTIESEIGFSPASASFTVVCGVDFDDCTDDIQSCCLSYKCVDFGGTENHRICIKPSMFEAEMKNIQQNLLPTTEEEEDIPKNNPVAVIANTENNEAITQPPSSVEIEIAGMKNNDNDNNESAANIEPNTEEEKNSTYDTAGDIVVASNNDDDDSKNKDVASSLLQGSSFPSSPVTRTEEVPINTPTVTVDATNGDDGSNIKNSDNLSSLSLPFSSVTATVVCGVDKEICTHDINSCCPSHECVGSEYHKSCQIKADATCYERWADCTQSIDNCCEGLDCKGNESYKRCEKTADEN